MLISSPEEISEFIFTIPKGSYLSIKELRRGLALKAGADNTCPVTTGIFLRMALGKAKRNDKKFCNLYFICLGDNDHRISCRLDNFPTNALINGAIFLKDEKWRK